ncbi:hypothetical protein JR316_0003624 [Psilocybe cubensis]|nr:hypothetical protein JR316_0003624 [Psilocybe cubensis]KAH9484144.1 hypothetical protein JR316_0003624 [Psilocybe cubensis]
MIINAILGTILWTSYGEASKGLEPHLKNHSILNTALSGAIAGACQAVAAAPADNVRLLLEHGFGGHTWSCAWKEVFKNASTTQSRPARLQDVRQLRGWLQDVGQMAGRGWNGWGWGVAKDTLGFSAFFLIFELSRRAGSTAKDVYVNLFSNATNQEYNGVIKKQIPAVINGVVLVSGGVIAGLTYEFIGRPFDVARRAIYLERLEKSHRMDSSYAILKRKIIKDSASSFFKASGLPADLTATSTRTKQFLRTIGRVGPWGVGFLVWEAYSSGLN